MDSEAASILASVRKAYGACRSYRDEGVVTQTFFRPRTMTYRRPFSTRFVRPDGFRFEFRHRRGEEHWDQYAVWLEAGVPKTWWTAQPGREDSTSLGLALAGATGVSGGSAHRVPYLLMPELSQNGGKSARPSESASVIEVDEASSLNCVVVEQPLRFGSVEQIWIDRTSFVIRRVVEPRHVVGLPPEAIEDMKARNPELAKQLVERALSEPSEVESITTYDAMFDVDIAPEELRFSPTME